MLCASANNGQREEKLVSNGMKRITFVAYVMNGGRVIQRKTKRQKANKVKKRLKEMKRKKKIEKVVYKKIAAYS